MWCLAVTRVTDQPPAVITRWSSLVDVAGSRAESTWRDIFAFLATPRVVADKKRLPGWSPATFADDKRADAACERLSALVLDYDDGRTSIDAAVELWRGYHGVLHTTHSHTPDAPRYRVVLPYSRLVTPAEHARMWAWAYARAEAAGHRLDPSTRNPSRFWFVPGVSETGAADYRCVSLTGPLLDVDAVLPTAPIAYAAPADRGTGAVPLVAWDVANDGVHPLVDALASRGLLGRRLPPRNNPSGPLDGIRWTVVCPWRDEHTSGHDHDTSTVVAETGVWHCSHGHCVGRKARDVLAALGIQLPRRVDDTSARRAVEAQLGAVDDDASTLADVRRQMSQALVLVQGRTVALRPDPGVGKSTAINERAAARALAGGYDSRTIIAVRDYASVAERVAWFHMRQIPVRWAHSIPELKHPDGAPVCVQHDAAKALQERGCLVGPTLCEGRGPFGRIGDECPELRKGCPAARTFAGDPNAAVIVTTHAMLPKVLRLKEDGNALVDLAEVHIDESPASLVRGVDLDPAVLAEARRVAARGHVAGRVLGAALDLWLGAWAAALSAGTEHADGYRAFVATDDGAQTLATYTYAARLGEQTDPLEHAHDVIARSTETNLQPSRTGLAYLRRGRNGDEIGPSAAWRAIEAARMIASGRAKRVERDGQTLRVRWLDPIVDALKLAASRRLSIADGTMHAADMEKLLDRALHQVDGTAPDLGNVTRVVIASKYYTRTWLVPDGNVDPERCRGAVRAVVAQIAATAPAGATILWATFRPLVRALQAAWDGKDATFASLLEPLRRRGDTVRWTYYRGPDTRGTNAHDDVHVTVSLGDDRANYRAKQLEAQSLGYDDADAYTARDARAALRQFHERSRPANRPDVAITMIHAGVLVPSGWNRSTQVVQTSVGRPRVDGESESNLAQQLVKLAGSVRAAAVAAGVTKSAMDRYCHGAPIPPETHANMSSAADRLGRK